MGSGSSQIRIEILPGQSVSSTLLPSKTGQWEQGSAGEHLYHQWAHAVPLDIYSMSASDQQCSTCQYNAWTQVCPKPVPPLTRHHRACCTASTEAPRFSNATLKSQNPCQQTLGLAGPVTSKNGQEKTLRLLRSWKSSGSLVSFPLAIILVNSN